MEAYLWGYLTSGAVDPVQWAINSMATIAGFVMGVLLMFAGWAVEIALRVNQNLMGSPSITAGFAISVAVVNLGFVLGIVLIAIATIIRYEPYGLRQTLWRFIVAAVLVNFSLTITGLIVNFADQLTAYFLNVISSGGISGFVQTFVSAVGGSKTVAQTSSGAVTFATPPYFQQITSLLTGIGITAIAFITLCAFAVMLIIRYVTLGVLLVIMPFAWLCWIFPATRNLWTKWWSNFTRWVFFAPIVMFFVYLAFLTWTSPTKFIDTKIVNPAAAEPQSVAQQLKGGNASFINNFINDITTTLADQIIIVGLMLGGLFAANSLSITGASYGMAAVKGTGRWAQSRATRTVTMPLRSERGRAATAALQRAGYGNIGQSKVFKYSGLGPLAALATRYAGRGIEAVGAKGGEDEIASAEKFVRTMTADQRATRISTMTAPQRIAALELDAKDGNLHKYKDLDRYTQGKRAEFKRYNKGYLLSDDEKGTVGDIDKAAASTPAARKEAKVVADAEKGIIKLKEDMSGVPKDSATFKDMDKQLQQLVAQKNALRQNVSYDMRGIARKLSKGTVPKELKDVYSDEEAFGSSADGKKVLQEELSRAIAAENPSVSASMISKLPAPLADKFKKQFSDGLKNEIEDVKKSGGENVVEWQNAVLESEALEKEMTGFAKTSAEFKEKDIKVNQLKVKIVGLEQQDPETFRRLHDLEETKKRFDKIIENDAIGFGPYYAESTGGGTTEAPAGGAAPTTT